MRSTVVWRVLVPVVLLLIGLLVATSARLASGTDLRAERRTDLVDLIRAEQDRVEAETNAVTELQRAGRRGGSSRGDDRRPTLSWRR